MMSLAPYAYVLLLTTLLALAAAAVEWSALGRIPVRHLWSAAIWMALLAPPAALEWHAASKNVAAHGVATPDPVRTVAVNAGRAMMRRGRSLVSHDAPIRALITHNPGWRVLAGAINSRLVAVLVPLWLCASLGLVAWLTISALYWRRARRHWRSTVVDGVQIDVSPATGPAVLGIISHRIVLPKWAMSMPLEQRKLMLAHECEHVSARDPERLALAVLALILMPWNVALWWCAARLRRAIEMDCDARVLCRYPRAKDYGHLLLDVASRRQGLGPMGIPAVALLRLPSELELRLRAMMRPKCAARRALVGSAGVALVAITAAFTLPVPELTTRHVGAPILQHAAVPQRGTVLHDVTVMVGRSRVTFDSVTYAPGTHTISAGPGTISRLELAPVRTDTTTDGGRDSLVTLERKVDSLQSLTSQMAARINAASDARLVVMNRGLDSEFDRTSPQIDAALKQYYPGLDTGKHDARIWFLADTNGRVLRTVRDDAAPLNVSPAIVHERFRDVNPSDILFMSIRPRTVANATINVSWVEVKRK